MSRALVRSRSVWEGVASRIAIVAVVVGVFCTWLAQDDLTLNGIEGPNNGWLCVLLAGPAFLWVRSMERGSWVGVVGVLASALVIGWTAAENWRDARRVLDAGVSYGLLLVLVAGAVLARSPSSGRCRFSATRAHSAPIRRGRGVGGRPAPSPSSCWRSSSSSSSGRCWRSRRSRAGRRRRTRSRLPARSGDRALRRARGPAARRRRDALRLVDGRDDRALARGQELLPADLRRRRAAHSSVHILMFGWREGEVGTSSPTSSCRR